MIKNKIEIEVCFNVTYFVCSTIKMLSLKENWKKIIIETCKCIENPVVFTPLKWSFSKQMRFNQANEWKTKSETESLCVLRILLSCYFASFFCMVVVFLFLLYCFMDTLRLMDRQLLIPRYAYNYLYQQYHSAQWEKKQKQKNDENGKSHYEHKWHTFVGILAMCIFAFDSSYSSWYSFCSLFSLSINKFYRSQSDRRQCSCIFVPVYETIDHLCSVFFRF